MDSFLERVFIRTGKHTNGHVVHPSMSKYNSNSNTITKFNSNYITITKFNSNYTTIT